MKFAKFLGDQKGMSMVSTLMSLAIFGVLAGTMLDITGNGFKANIDLDAKHGYRDLVNKFDNLLVKEKFCTLALGGQDIAKNLNLKIDSLGFDYSTGSQHFGWEIESFKIDSITDLPNPRLAKIILKAKQLKGFRAKDDHVREQEFMVHMTTRFSSDVASSGKGFSAAVMSGPRVTLIETCSMGDDLKAVDSPSGRGCTDDVCVSNYDVSCEGASCITHGNYCKGSSCIAYSYDSSCNNSGCCTGPSCCTANTFGKKCGVEEGKCPEGKILAGFNLLTGKRKCINEEDYVVPKGECIGPSCVTNGKYCSGSSCIAYGAGATCDGSGCCAGPGCCVEQPDRCSLR